MILALGATPSIAQQQPLIPTQTVPLTVVTDTTAGQPAISAIQTYPGGPILEGPVPTTSRIGLYANSAGIGVVSVGYTLGGYFTATVPTGIGIEVRAGLYGITARCSIGACTGISAFGGNAASIGIRGEGATGVLGVASAPTSNFGQPTFAGSFVGNVKISQDLAVTGEVQSPTIDALTARIEALTARLALVESRASGPGLGTILPARIRAESYNLGGQGVGYWDSTPGNEQGAPVLRTDDVDLKVTGSGDYAVGWFTAGEWLAYTVAAPADGTYTMRARVGTPLPGRTFHVEIDGRDVTGDIAAPQLAAWDQFVTLELPSVTLVAGVHVVKIVMGSEDFMDFQWLEITR